MSARSDLLRAELDAVEADEAFAAVKADPAVVRGDKKWKAASDKMHAARSTYRTLREKG